MKRTKIDRNHKTEKKLDAMWNNLSEKARDVIATTDMWVIDELFGNLETPDEVNKFIDEEWDDVNNFIDEVNKFIDEEWDDVNNFIEEEYTED